METGKFLAQGAEAIVERISFFGIDAVRKIRIEKKYRRKELDFKLRIERNRREARLLVRLKELGIPCPFLLYFDDFTLIMSYIPGISLRDYANREKLGALWAFRTLGEYLGKMHSSGIFHGDPTTSNFIVQKDRLVLIDLGLSGFSDEIEEHATDVVVFKRSLHSTHWEIEEEAWESFLKGYLRFSSIEVLKRAEEIEKRARYYER